VPDQRQGPNASQAIPGARAFWQRRLRKFSSRASATLGPPGRIVPRPSSRRPKARRMSGRNAEATRGRSGELRIGADELRTRRRCRGSAARKRQQRTPGVAKRQSHGSGDCGRGPAHGEAANQLEGLNWRWRKIFSCGAPVPNQCQPKTALKPIAVPIQRQHAGSRQDTAAHLGPAPDAGFALQEVSTGYAAPP
jgi:hypothetical protein